MGDRLATPSSQAAVRPSPAWHLASVRKGGRRPRQRLLRRRPRHRQLRRGPGHGHDVFVSVVNHD